MVWKAAYVYMPTLTWKVGKNVHNEKKSSSILSHLNGSSELIHDVKLLQCQDAHVFHQ